MKVLQKQSEQKKLSFLQPLLQEALGKQEYLPLSISYIDAHTGNETLVPVMCIGLLTDPSFLIQEALVFSFLNLFYLVRRGSRQIISRINVERRRLITTRYNPHLLLYPEFCFFLTERYMNCVY